MKQSGSKPPAAYQTFIKRYPRLGEAWQAIRAEEESGPLDEKTARLVKLGVAIGATREGAVHSAVRKALAAGASRAEVEQVIALAAGTIGLPTTVAVSTWVQEQLREGKA
jgi:alkylhydroperoxidase/carboxymuconolactone decarboxylase family protein YurZ